MAQAFETAWGESVSGLVVTRYGHSVPTKHVEVVEASHPVPDQARLDAARRIMDLVRDLREDDLAMALISGGGSVLLSAPYLGRRTGSGAITARLRHAHRQDEQGSKRTQRHQRAPPGRLGHPARVCTFVVSDMTGDDPALVASGPTIPIAGSREEVRQLVALHALSLPANVVDLLNSDRNASLRSVMRDLGDLAAAPLEDEVPEQLRESKSVA